jgi:hypothetical protein
LVASAFCLVHRMLGSSICTLLRGKHDDELLSAIDDTLEQARSTLSGHLEDLRSSRTQLEELSDGMEGTSAECMCGGESSCAGCTGGEVRRALDRGLAKCTELSGGINAHLDRVVNASEECHAQIRSLRLVPEHHLTDDILETQGRTLADSLCDVCPSLTPEMERRIGRQAEDMGACALLAAGTLPSGEPRMVVVARVLDCSNERIAQHLRGTQESLKPLLSYLGRVRSNPTRAHPQLPNTLEQLARVRVESADTRKELMRLADAVQRYVVSAIAASQFRSEADYVKFNEAVAELQRGDGVDEVFVDMARYLRAQLDDCPGNKREPPTEEAVRLRSHLEQCEQRVLNMTPNMP